MAVLTPDQLAEMRRQFTATLVAQTNTKAPINAAFQAIEDQFEASKAAWNTAINAATAPVTFTNAQKKTMVAYFMLQKYGREVV